MAIYKFGHSVESLHKDKIENLEKELKSQTKLLNKKLNDMSDKLEKFNNLQNVQEIQFTFNEKNMILIAKLILDINKHIEDVKTYLKYLEQDNENNFLKEKNEILLGAAKLVEEQQTILRNHFERNLIFISFIIMKLKRIKRNLRHKKF